MAAPCNSFTNEQIEILKQSRYVESVGTRSVYFTNEFKRLYWQMYTDEKLKPHEILRQLGIEYHLIGAARVRGITDNLKKQHKRDGCISGTIAQVNRPASRTKEEQIERLRAENEYLKQELEFVKKIIAISGEVKR